MPRNHKTKKNNKKEKKQYFSLRIFLISDNSNQSEGILNIKLRTFLDYGIFFKFCGPGGFL